MLIGEPEGTAAVKMGNAAHWTEVGDIRPVAYRRDARTGPTGSDPHITFGGENLPSLSAAVVTFVVASVFLSSSVSGAESVVQGPKSRHTS